MALAICEPASSAIAGAAASDWKDGHNSRTRLIAGAVKQADGSQKLVAGLQIELASGWKTYWRYPGDAGGVPPELDWSKSSNVARTELLFPAPIRLKDPVGDSIGYKHAVTFPVLLTPADAGKPLQLDLHIMIGVCKNICIPEEQQLTLTFDPRASDDAAVTKALQRALDELPADAAADPERPHIASLKVETVAGKPALLVDAVFPAGSGGADLFTEAVDGSFTPMPDRQDAGADGHVTFHIDLAKTDDFRTPSGKQLRLTLVSDAGASVTLQSIP